MGSSADCKLERKKKTWPKTDRQTLKFCVFLPSPHTLTHTLGEFSGTLFPGPAVRCPLPLLVSSYSSRYAPTGSRCGSMLTVNLQTLAPDYLLILRATDERTLPLSFVHSLALSLPSSALALQGLLRFRNFAAADTRKKQPISSGRARKTHARFVSTCKCTLPARLEC